MTVLRIIFAVILFITFILCLKVNAKFTIKDEFKFKVSILGIRLFEYPSPEKKMRVNKRTLKNLSKPQKPQKSKKSSHSKDTKKEKEKKSLSENLSMLISVLQVFFSRFKRFLRIKLTRIHINVATDDAAKTAILYGTVSQAVAYITAIMYNSGCIVKRSGKENINVTADFVSEKTTADVEITLSLAIWHFLDILIHTGLRYIKKSNFKSKLINERK